jgi:hypothetical protein
MAYKLREEEEGSESSLRLDKDVILKTDDNIDDDNIDNIINALEDIQYYGDYKNSIRTPNMNKEIDIQFGPTYRKSLEDNFGKLPKEEWLAAFSKTPNADKMYDVLENNKGKFPIKTGDALKDFTKNFKIKPNLLYWNKVDDNTLVFPKDNNKGEKYIKKVVDTVLSNANIKNYKYSKEASGTVSEGKSMYELRKLIREEVKSLLK